MNTIEPEIIQSLKTWFNEYVAGFVSEEPEIQRNFDLKREHTYRVCDDILDIGRRLRLDDQYLRIAEITALFHDIGRFEQFRDYLTFLDRRSVDHAHLGVRILRRHDVLKRLEPSIREIIYKAIEYHNRAGLPEDESEVCLFFAKLLRDADKLDIWRVVIEFSISGYQVGRPRPNQVDLIPDTPGYSPEVIADLMNQQIVDQRHVVNHNDIKLLRIGWVYDLNFLPTFEIVRERDYLSRLSAMLPPSPMLDTIVARAEEYIAEKLLRK